MYFKSMKTCSKCNNEKPIDDFYRAKDGVGGRRGDCKACFKSKAREYHHNNKEQARTQKKKYYKTNSVKLRKASVKYHKERCAKDPVYRLTHSLRCRVRSALYGTNKSEATSKLIGCSIDRLRVHIELKFTDGMTWDNYGKWHVDHIIPCASFDMEDSDQQKKCFHYTNLQPLWAEDNLRKSSSVQSFTVSKK